MQYSVIYVCARMEVKSKRIACCVVKISFLQKRQLPPGHLVLHVTIFLLSYTAFMNYPSHTKCSTRASICTLFLRDCLNNTLHQLHVSLLDVYHPSFLLQQTSKFFGEDIAFEIERRLVGESSSDSLGELRRVGRRKHYLYCIRRTDEIMDINDLSQTLKQLNNSLSRRQDTGSR